MSIGIFNFLFKPRVVNVVQYQMVNRYDSNSKYQWSVSHRCLIIRVDTDQATIEIPVVNRDFIFIISRRYTILTSDIHSLIDAIPCKSCRLLLLLVSSISNNKRENQVVFALSASQNHCLQLRILSSRCGYR